MSEQFENNIRKKLEEADVPFDPAAWEKMKTRLDESDRHRPVFWWWTSGLLLLLLLSAGGWWWYAQQGESKVETPVEKIITAQTPPTPNSNTAENVTAPAGNPGAPNTTAANITGKTTQEEINKNSFAPRRSEKTVAGNPVSTEKKIIPQAPLTETIVPQKTTTNNISTQTQSAKSESGNSQKVANQSQPAKTESGNNKTATNQPQPAKSEPVNNQTTTNQSQSAKSEPGNIQNQPAKTEPVNNQTAINQPVKTQPANNQTATPDTTGHNYTNNVDNPKDSTLLKKKKQKRGFEGGITLGPDYNIAPSFRMGKLGFGAGLLLRYHVNNRLNLSVGAIYTKKVYGATPKDYKFTYPTNYVRIDANCDVLDVPLNVHYTFLDKPKSTWSVMAGASSYFMLKEKYDYYWANNTKRTHEFSNQNQHYFSVLNIGATYERKTAGRLKWGLQPYIKVPMSGVGEGKVKLSSAGISLQLMLGKKN